MEFLKKLFGTNEDGTEKAMTWSELETLLSVEGAPKIVDLSAGGYVDKQKHDRIKEELTGTKEQLAAANAKIQEFVDMDIDGIKNAAAEYKATSEASIKELQDKLEQQDNLYSAKDFLRGYEFSSEFAGETVLNQFLAQGFKKDEDGKYLGAEDYMNGLMEKHPDAFKPKEVKQAEESKNNPFFSRGGGNLNPPNNDGNPWTLEQVMEYANNNPGANIDALLDKMN